MSYKRKTKAELIEMIKMVEIRENTAKDERNEKEALALDLGEEVDALETKVKTLERDLENYKSAVRHDEEVKERQRKEIADLTHRVRVYRQALLIELNNH